MPLAAFAVLIGFAVFVGMSTNVSGKLKHVLAANNSVSQSSVVSVNGKMAKSHTSSFSQSGIETQSDLFLMPQGDRPHGCHHDSSINPSDY